MVLGVKNNALKTEFARVSRFNLSRTILKLSLVGLCTYSVSDEYFLWKGKLFCHNLWKFDSTSWGSWRPGWNYECKQSSCVRQRGYLEACKTQKARVFCTFPIFWISHQCALVTAKWPCRKNPAEWSEYNLNCLAINFSDFSIAYQPELDISIYLAAILKGQSIFRILEGQAEFIKNEALNIPQKKKTLQVSESW